MAVRGIDTQMLATKPADLSGTQMRINKQDENHMAQTAASINKAAELDKERPLAAVKPEGKKVGTEEREKGDGRHPERKKKSKSEQDDQNNKSWTDPMLSLPVEKGKYAKRESHRFDEIV